MKMLMTSPRKILWPGHCIAALLLTLAFSGQAPAHAETKFKPVPTQYLAALADPAASSGTGAESWGLWRLDPGPRGVRLGSYEALKAHGGKAPSDWQFDAGDWWLEEHGLIMEKPEFPVPPGKYLVTGNREAQTVLTVFAKDADGKQRWELADGVTVHDVTHLRCRSARYTPAADGKMCSPAAVKESSFPVEPGAAMPPVENCSKQDYAVLFIVGVEG
jgi:hypothetical protein